MIFKIFKLEEYANGTVPPSWEPKLKWVFRNQLQEKANEVYTVYDAGLIVGNFTTIKKLQYNIKIKSKYT